MPHGLAHPPQPLSPGLGTWCSISMAADDMRQMEEDGDLRVFM